MKTKTCKTIEIIEKAKGFNDVDVTLYWLELNNSDRDLFDNFSDFLTAINKLS